MSATHSSLNPASIRFRLHRLFMESESLRGYSLLSPSLLAILLGLAMPLIVLFTLSFWIQEYLDFIRTFSFKNYLDFFQKPIYIKILFKSIRMSCLVTVVTVLLAYPMAYYIYKAGPKLKTLLLIIVILPKLSNMLVLVYGLQILLAKRPKRI